jgi:hypothetical protein
MRGIVYDNGRAKFICEMSTYPGRRLPLIAPRRNRRTRPALRKSIDLAMEPNRVGKRVNYLEIYEPDVLADEMQPDLHYAASLFAR